MILCEVRRPFLLVKRNTHPDYVINDGVWVVSWELNPNQAQINNGIPFIAPFSEDIILTEF